MIFKKKKFHIGFYLIVQLAFKLFVEEVVLVAVAVKQRFLLHKTLDFCE
jgi:hypothetical protein